MSFFLSWDYGFRTELLLLSLITYTKKDNSLMVQGTRIGGKKRQRKKKLYKYIYRKKNKHDNQQMVESNSAEYFNVTVLCRRFWRRKVHLIWGSPVASAMLHLHPVLRVTGGRRLLPQRRKDPVPWLSQQPIREPLPFPSVSHWLNLLTPCHSISTTPRYYRGS